jgi:hypothetical protein
MQENRCLHFLRSDFTLVIVTFFPNFIRHAAVITTITTVAALAGAAAEHAIIATCIALYGGQWRY